MVRGGLGRCGHARITAVKYMQIERGRERREVDRGGEKLE